MDHQAVNNLLTVADAGRKEREHQLRGRCTSTFRQTGACEQYEWAYTEVALNAVISSTFAADA